MSEIKKEIPILSPHLYVCYLGYKDLKGTILSFVHLAIPIGEDIDPSKNEGIQQVEKAKFLPKSAPLVTFEFTYLGDNNIVGSGKYSLDFNQIYVIPKPKIGYFIGMDKFMNLINQQAMKLDVNQYKR